MFRWYRLIALLPVLFVVIATATIVSCGGSGGGSTSKPTQGFELEFIIVNNGTPPQPTPTPVPTKGGGKTPTPTPTAQPEGSATTVAASGGQVDFNAQGAFVHGGKTRFEDITDSINTIWTSDNPAAVMPPAAADSGGMYTGGTTGCACIKASSAGIDSNFVSVDSLAVPGPNACVTPCPPPPPTPTSTATPHPDVVACALSETTLSVSSIGPPRGTLQWVFDSGSRLRGAIVPGPDGNVYFITKDGNLHAIDAKGNQIFARVAAGLAPAVAPDGTVFVANTGDSVSALNSDGTAAWKLPLPRGNGPLAASDLVYVNSGNDVAAVTRAGQFAWTVPVGPATAGIAMAGGAIVAVPGGAVTALSSSGSTLWSFTPPGGFSAAIALSGSSVLIGSTSGTVYALDSSSGVPLWQAPTSAPVIAGPVAGSDGAIYFGSDVLHALTPGGASQWTIAPPPAADALTAFGSGVLDVTSDSVATVFDSAGATAWASRSFGPVDRVAYSAAGGVLYVGASSGWVYAIK